ncbi:hypothetical protein HGB13_00175 [bacterium]|nr:hypothetical protein [bacterium]
MSKDFKIAGGLHGVPTVFVAKASGTVIEAGDMVGITDGLVVKAGATTAAIGYAPHGAASGKLKVEVTCGNDFELVGVKDADAAFAVDQRGDYCDLKGTTDMIIDNDTSSTNVLQICGDKDNGVVGSKAGIRVKIAKPVLL